MDTKPCPFCGSTDISHAVRFTVRASLPMRQSECQNCGALGPLVEVNEKGFGDDDVKSAKAWNDRPERPHPRIYPKVS